MTCYVRFPGSVWEKANSSYETAFTHYTIFYRSNLEPGEVPQEGYVCAPAENGGWMMFHVLPLHDQLYRIQDRDGNVRELMCSMNKIETPF